MSRKILSRIFLVFLLLIPSSLSWGQGPRPAYYYHPATELSWASCYLYQKGGSLAKIPFLPVVCTRFRWAPLGVGKYEKDVLVDGPLVFIGNGVFKENVWNSYIGRSWVSLSGEIDVSGKIVMFCYDFPDSIEEEVEDEIPLARRISEAESRKALAVVLFSSREDFPFLKVRYKNETEIPEIPVITITRSSALHILCGSGLDGESLLKEWEQSKKPPQSTELISRLKLQLTGNFTKAETANFLFRFQRDVISQEEAKKLAEVNEKALTFLFENFKDDKELKWKKLYTVYFRDFDSKIFYTHYWGSGFASEEGMFMIYKEGVLNYGLAVHENTHILTGLNWGNSNSFMNEGAGKYTEALATEKDRNHLETVNYLRENKLFLLEEMVTFRIGFPGLKTEVAYPASGSFVAFLVEKYGLKRFKEAYVLEGRLPGEREKENSWQKAYGKSLRALEKEWLNWLLGRFKADKKLIQDHLAKYVQKQKAIKVDPKILETYVGSYKLSQDIVVEVVRENDCLFVLVPGMGKIGFFPESETNFYSKVIDVKISFVRNEKAEVTQLILYQGGSSMAAQKIKK